MLKLSAIDLVRYMEPLVLEHILDGREDPTNLPLELLKNITNNFSEEREIGHGGFATVYKGVLPNGNNVAVKRIRNSHTIDEKLFYREVNSLLTMNHPNIVRFLGFCASTDQTALKIEGKREHIYAEIRERLLCFQYISNGNMEKLITDELRGLDWSTRYRLIKGICDGLHYLHMEKYIYHMDLKPANILVDDDMVPKITDFGLSRLDQKSQTISVDRHGTLGYCAPEYLTSGKISTKSDIYSLGMIIIELVTGKKSVPDNNTINVLRRWRHRWRKTGKETPLCYQQVTKCINIGLLCQEIDPCKRPLIGQIVCDINEMEGTYSQISNDYKSTVGQIRPYSEDDMLGIEPLEIHFHFERNREMSSLLQLSNDTDSHIAFVIQNMSHLPYNTKPQEGIVPPRSKCGVDITLQPMEEAPQYANVFIVRSTKVIYGLRAEDITTAMFSTDTGNVVDEVNLDVVFDQELQIGLGRTVPEDSQEYEDKEKKPMVYKMQSSSFERIYSSKSKAADELMNFPLTGRWSQMNKLRSYIYQAYNGDSRVLSVCGIPGIGKSALVRNMYNRMILDDNQFSKYIWVDISYPFNVKEFSRSLLLDYNSESDPIEECRELLSKHRCLVVVDDLQSKEEWDLIQAALVSRHFLSVIIVITTKASIATYCTNNKDQVFNVKVLEADAAMDLFWKEVHRKNPLSCLNSNCVELEELILKCGGLPKVIISVASSLATNNITWMHNVHYLNLNFMHHLETNPEYVSLSGLFDWMHSYFRSCPDSLKSCIFDLSFLPQHENIQWKRLIRRWIAEGYFTDSYEESAVQKGEKFLSNLLELGIIQQLPQFVTAAFSDTGMICYQVNRFIREYIVSRRTEENLVSELGSNCFLTSRGRCLTISRDWDSDKTVFENIDFSRLRSLTVFGIWKSFFISESMNLLQVLDLESAVGVTDKDLEKMVKGLYQLKYLSLRRCSEIFHLPSSIGDLRLLETLDVRHTSIATLPESISRLQKLQHILAGAAVQTSTSHASSIQLREFRRSSCLVGTVVPLGIGELTALHTLGVINIGASGRTDVMKEIQKLTRLHKLSVSGINRYNCKDFSEALAHAQLNSLSVRLDEDSQDCFDDISLPWENLRSLKLYGLKDKLPLSMNHLHKLSKLELEMDTLNRNDIEFLANLPELCILRLRLKQFEDDKLHFYAELYGEQLLTFKNVKILEIACSSGQSLNVTFGSKSMKNLELLKIDCSTASYQLNGLNDLTELKQVLLKGSDGEIKKALEKQLLENHPETRPTVKLEGLPLSS